MKTKKKEESVEKEGAAHDEPFACSDEYSRASLTRAVHDDAPSRFAPPPPNTSSSAGCRRRR